MREENAQLKAWMEAMEGTDAWKKTFPDPKAFADAIVEYASLDYFVHHSSSLAEPRPWCHGEALAPPTAVVDLPAALDNLEPQGALNAPPPSPPPTPLRDLPGASKPINQSTERTFEEMATERGLPGGHDRGNKDAYIPGTPEWYEWLKGRRRLHQRQDCKVGSAIGGGDTRRRECERRREPRRERRRSLGQVAPPERGAADCSGERCESIGAWHSLWTRRIECWWMALPIFEQQKISGCLGALGLHLGSRFDAFIRIVSGGTGAPRAPPVPAEPGCEWIRGGGLVGQLELPSFPQFDEGFDFELPPLPRLVPSWEHLQSLRLETPTGWSEASASAPAVAGAIGIGAVSGAAASVLLICSFGGSKARRLLSEKARPALR